MSIYSNNTLFQSVTKVNDTSYLVCFDVPPHIISNGIWGDPKSGRTPMKSFFPMFESQVLIIFALTQICGFLLKPLRVPLFISQMMSGLILGAAFQLKPAQPYMQMLFPFGTHDIISAISSIGFVLFIFMNGVQMDFSMVTRTGNKAWTISIIGIVVPLVFGFAPLILFPDKTKAFQKSHGSSIYVALVSHIVSAFAVIASQLSELKIQNSELGRLALSSALVSDIFCNIITTIGVTIVMNPEIKVVTINLFSLLTFGILIPLVCRPAMFWIIKHTPEGRPVKEHYVHIIITMAFLFGVVAVKIDQEFILGAFIFGLSVPEGPPLGSAVVKKVQLFGTALFLPIFVTTSVLKADFSMDYFSSPTVMTTCFVVIGIHLVKIAACFVSAVCCKMPISDALSLALILNTKGVVEIGIYNALHDSNLIDGQIYGVMMISVMVMASIVQWSVKLLYDPTKKYAGYQKRNISSLKGNTELRILVTIHKQNHISPMTDFLNLCHPTPSYPVSINALHLIELVGRAVPVFIPHCLKRQASSRRHKSYSVDVILAFNIFHNKNPDAEVFPYTAISPPGLMYEDVCNLALDKLASIIILPFHQRWSTNGIVESDDKRIRALNSRVLEIAPCSVGILITRASSKTSPPETRARLGVIYLGGEDDQEVLCIAKRAIRNKNVMLVVYHLVVEEHEELILREFWGGEDSESSNSYDNVRYEKVFVKDGSETASFLRTVVHEHDFFVVGRRHGIECNQTKGLTKWIEFQELGLVGDFLSSPDLNSSASVLVVQQQLSRKTRSSCLL